jgi:hypothetical protein
MGANIKIKKRHGMNEPRHVYNNILNNERKRFIKSFFLG